MDEVLRVFLLTLLCLASIPQVAQNFPIKNDAEGASLGRYDSLSRFGFPDVDDDRPSSTKSRYYEPNFADSWLKEWSLIRVVDGTKASSRRLAFLADSAFERATTIVKVWFFGGEMSEPPNVVVRVWYWVLEKLGYHQPAKYTPSLLERIYQILAYLKARIVIFVRECTQWVLTASEHNIWVDLSLTKIQKIWSPSEISVTKSTLIQTKPYKHSTEHQNKYETWSWIKLVLRYTFAFIVAFVGLAVIFSVMDEMENIKRERKHHCKCESEHDIKLKFFRLIADMKHQGLLISTDMPWIHDVVKSTKRERNDGENIMTLNNNNNNSSSSSSSSSDNNNNTIKDQCEEQ